MTDTRRRPPAWSSRPYSEPDREAVLALFEEPDFHYRTEQPDTRSAAEIQRLLDDDTQVLLADGRVVGLYALSAEGVEHGCHYLLTLRLSGAVPEAWWSSAYAEVVAAARWRHEIVRLSVRFATHDERGLRSARATGLTEEGILAGVTARDGARHGRVYFSQVWSPVS
ncbi:hypothetical protein [Streptomyces profundus]|uniref:hypothetical protein n=1 Tax=Streptomyces profundus TaxID=2867410 RepID=UPI001D15E5C8|nr:hypothetical protein [Streptomyces sp. MA3_2.13]UED82957.1 hypothetical protein K4G22_01100 [Streptomyces sp. MA3_2.13]